MKGFIIALILATAMAGGAHYPPLPQASSEEESLLIRRIVAFWQDHEYAFARNHIEVYLKENPSSVYVDHFYAMLGDMAQQDGAFEEAIGYYQKIQGEALKEHARLKKWEALYHMGHFGQLYQETAPLIGGTQDEELQFYYAEGAFREALSQMNFPEGRSEALRLCREALPYYAQLENSKVFGSHAALARAEIYQILGQPEQASSLYHKVAAHEQESDILFHTACALIEDDRPKALELLRQIARSEGAKASEAAYECLLLEAEEGDWETILADRDMLITRLKGEKGEVAHYYLGMISFEREMLEQALTDLQQCVGRNLPAQYEQKALVTLMRCAGKLGQWEVCEMAFDALCSQFPQEEGEATLMLAAAYQERGERKRALKIYERVASAYAGSDYGERASLEKASILIDQHELGKAHSLLMNYLTQYPHSGRIEEMMRLAIEVSLAQLESENAYGQLAADLERALGGQLFQGVERSEMETLLAKAYLKLGRTQTALQLLEGLYDPDPLLMTECYVQEGSSPVRVAEWGERALEGYPQENGLHLHLFNAYLEMAKEEDNPLLTRKAAEHLSAIVNIYPISLDNKLWLLHYLGEHAPLQAIPLLEGLVQDDTDVRRFDEQACLLAKLYQDAGHLERAEPLLEKIIALGQKSASDAKLKLAQIYSMQGKTAEARALYEKLETSNQLPIAFAARLQLARLDFAHDPETSLKRLHDLAQRKSLAHEPIHLEAALDYADLLASTYPEKERPYRLLEFLQAVKHEFTQQDTIWSKDYHASRVLSPEKDVIYQAYMRYVDARIYALQAAQTQDRYDAKVKRSAASALFSTLRQGKYAVTPYIKEKAIVGLDAP